MVTFFPYRGLQINILNLLWFAGNEWEKGKHCGALWGTAVQCGLLSQLTEGQRLAPVARNTVKWQGWYAYLSKRLPKFILRTEREVKSCSQWPCFYTDAEGTSNLHLLKSNYIHHLALVFDVQTEDSPLNEITGCGSSLRTRRMKASGLLRMTLTHVL